MCIYIYTIYILFITHKQSICSKTHSTKSLAEESCTAVLAVIKSLILLFWIIYYILSFYSHFIIILSF